MCANVLCLPRMRAHTICVLNGQGVGAVGSVKGTQGSRRAALGLDYHGWGPLFRDCDARGTARLPPSPTPGPRFVRNTTLDAGSGFYGQMGSCVLNATGRQSHTCAYICAMEPQRTQICSWCRTDPAKVGGYCTYCSQAYRRARTYFIRGYWTWGSKPCKCCGKPFRTPPRTLDGPAMAFFRKLYQPKVDERTRKIAGLLAALSSRTP